jgi:transposase
MTTMTELDVLVTVGVDTHADTHVAAALDQLGRIIDTTAVPSTRAGYAQLLEWASGLGVIDRVGIEGTGSYGAGLARWLTAQGIAVVEVDRPDRRARRRHGKTDEVDATAAAHAAQSGKATAIPKAGTGPVEAIRVIHLTRNGAVKARTQAANQLRALVVTAPDDLRDRLRSQPSTAKLAAAAAALRPGSRIDTPTAATKLALRAAARRWQALNDEAAALEAHLAALTTAAAPELTAQHGVGAVTAAQLLVTAGDNPDRMHSEAAYANLCGTSPLEISSGKSSRHRLNRGGDRQANAALHTIAITRLKSDPRTRAYAKKRTTEGKTRRDITRSLKRYIARELFPIIKQSLTPTPTRQP